MSLQAKKKTLLAKLETTYGVDPSPTGAVNAVLAKNLNVQPINAETVSRDIERPFFGNSEQLLAEVNTSIDFEIELAGSGTPGEAPAWGELLQACAFKETVEADKVVYSPVSDLLKSICLYYNVDGVLHKITGARGSVEITVSAKQIPVLKFTMLGIFNDPTDTVAPAVDFSKFMLPQVANTQNTPAFSLFGYQAPLEQMTVNMANEVIYRSLIGFQAVEITDRKPTGSFVLEAPRIATKDFFSLAKAGTPGVMSITHGSVAGNIVKIDAPAVSLQNPSYQDSQGVLMISIPFTPTPVDGNDELTITVK
jgi:hypothetical protein